MTKNPNPLDKQMGIIRSYFPSIFKKEAKSCENNKALQIQKAGTKTIMVPAMVNSNPLTYFILFPYGKEFQ